MCENAYLSIKNPKASRALKRALDPGRRMLASLARLCFAMSATFGLRSWGPPLDQILDPHLNVVCSECCLLHLLLALQRAYLLDYHRPFHSVVCSLFVCLLQPKVLSFQAFMTWVVCIFFCAMLYGSAPKQLETWFEPRISVIEIFGSNH